MKTKNIITILITAITLTLLVVVLILLMRGDTKTSGEFPENVEGQSLVCESRSIKYPIYDYDDAKARDLKITANFYSKKLDAMSLAYSLFYDDNKQITASEAHNHAAMNKDFAKNNLGADAFEAHYSNMNDSMKMTLYVRGEDFNIIAAKYFMIEAQEKRDLPDTIDEFEKIYKSQGFSCNKSKNDV